ncbi:hypothetical protein [Arthrobacter woluwensis]|uniref:hypothetical protein n=1 Tax=Arthrobacter woluwensis TaxID=156980 RepID=UPI000943E025|nr:hypothetical protein [Arthrobacter woluwensis]
MSVSLLGDVAAVAPDASEAPSSGSGGLLRPVQSLYRSRGSEQEPAGTGFIRLSVGLVEVYPQL